MNCRKYFRRTTQPGKTSILLISARLSSQQHLKSRSRVISHRVSQVGTSRVSGAHWSKVSVTPQISPTRQDLDIVGTEPWRVLNIWRDDSECDWRFPVPGSATVYFFAGPGEQITGFECRLWSA